MREMSLHPKCSQIDIVSRSAPQNLDFFNGLHSGLLYGNTIDHTFSFGHSISLFLEGLKLLDITHYDIVFLRLPRPISDDFLLWLKSVAPQAVFINEPQGIVNTSNKKFLLHVAELCPPIKICHSVADIMNFSLCHDIVLKPLRGYGGQGILKLSDGIIESKDESIKAIDYLNDHIDEVADGYLVMKFLPNVSKGDKRIIVVNGEILASSLRLPLPDSWLCNVSQGGTSVKSDITKEEENIVKVIAPLMRENGILIYGIDTLEDDNNKRVLSEINTLSIGGFPQAESQSGNPVIKQTINRIFEYAEQSL